MPRFFSCKQQPGKLTDSVNTGNVSKKEECNIKIYGEVYSSIENTEDIFFWKNGNQNGSRILETDSLFWKKSPL